MPGSDKPQTGRVGLAPLSSRERSLSWSFGLSDAFKLAVFGHTQDSREDVNLARGQHILINKSAVFIGFCGHETCKNILSIWLNEHLHLPREAFYILKLSSIVP